MVPDGYNILNEPVNRLFPNDDAEKPEFQVSTVFNFRLKILQNGFIIVVIWSEAI